MNDYAEECAARALTHTANICSPTYTLPDETSYIIHTYTPRLSVYMHTDICILANILKVAV